MTIASGSTLLSTLRDLDSLFTCLNQVTQLRNSIPNEVLSIRNTAATEPDLKNQYYYQGLTDCYNQIFNQLTAIIELVDPEAFNDNEEQFQEEVDYQEEE